MNHIDLLQYLSAQEVIVFDQILKDKNLSINELFLLFREMNQLGFLLEGDKKGTYILQKEAFTTFFIERFRTDRPLDDLSDVEDLFAANPEYLDFLQFYLEPKLISEKMLLEIIEQRHIMVLWKEKAFGKLFNQYFLNLSEKQLDALRPIEEEPLHDEAPIEEVLELKSLKDLAQKYKNNKK